jgi:hypothetical protein
MGVANTAQPKLSPGHPLAGAFLRVLVLVHKQARLPGQAKQRSGYAEHRKCRLDRRQQTRGAKDWCHVKPSIGT